MPKLFFVVVGKGMIVCPKGNDLGLQVAFAGFINMEKKASGGLWYDFQLSIVKGASGGL